MVTCTELEEHGFTVIEAEDGAVALELLRKSEVDVLVTDIRMPIIDGWTLAEEARKLNPRIGVVYMTGYVATPDRKVQNSAFLYKPCSADDVVHKIRTLTNERQSDCA